MAAAPALLDEIIEEFLLRLPPAEPETLVQAAFVCKPWYRIVSIPRFRRRFREFHRAAPLLGFFSNSFDTRFVPTSSFRLAKVRRFRFGRSDGGSFRRTFDASSSRTFDARHGRVLIDSWDDMDERRNFLGQWHGMDVRFLIVWDPTTDEGCDVELPPPDLPEVWGFQFQEWNATVLCAAVGSATCHHHDCHGKPFTIVLVGPGAEAEDMSFLHVYSSEADSWSEPIPVRKCCW